MAACAAGAISLQDGMACITEALCRSCEACVRACPQGAIIAVRSGDVLPAPATAAVSRPQAQLASAESGGALARLAARALPAIGTALAATAMFLLSTMGPATSQGTVTGYMVLLGVGVALSLWGMAPMFDLNGIFLFLLVVGLVEA